MAARPVLLGPCALIAAAVLGCESPSSARAVGSVTVSPDSLLLVVTTDSQLQLVARGPDGHEVFGHAVTWQTSAPQTATVTPSGLVTGVAPGRAAIIATVEGVSDTAAITVRKSAIRVFRLIPNLIREMPAGVTFRMVAVAVDAAWREVDGHPIWRSASPTIAAVSDSGVVTAVALGTASIIATLEGKSDTAEITVVPRQAIRPLVLHYDGTAWTTVLGDTNDTETQLNAIWGAGAGALFAGGGSRSYVYSSFTAGTQWGQCGGKVTLRSTALGWGPTVQWCPKSQGPEWVLQSAGVLSLSGTSASSVYRVSYNSLWGMNAIFHQFSSYESVVDYFDGVQWRNAYASHCGRDVEMTGEMWCDNPPVRAVWSSSETDVFLVSDLSCVLRYTLHRGWAMQPGTQLPALRGIWGSSATDVFVVGWGILHFDGASWTVQTLPVRTNFYSVWGSSPTDVFAVGADGTILHYDGVTWTAQTSGTPRTLRAVWGSSPTDVFAVGDSSTILHYDGTRWSAQTLPVPVNLGGVWGSSPTDVHAVVGSPPALVFWIPAPRALDARPDDLTGRRGTARPVRLFSSPRTGG